MQSTNKECKTVTIRKDMFPMKKMSLVLYISVSSKNISFAIQIQVLPSIQFMKEKDISLIFPTSLHTK